MAEIVPIFKAKIQDNILLLEDREKYNNYLASLFAGEYEVIVRKPKKIRTPRANRHYWGVVLKLISEATGEDIEDLHNHFAYKWLSFKGKSGRLTTRRSTADLSKAEFTEYMNKIMLWAEQFLDITFPEPDSIDYQFIIN